MRQSADDTVYCYYTKCPNTSCEHHTSHIHEFYVFRKYDYFKECQYWDLPETYYSCDSCEHGGKLWGEEPCDSCCGNHSGYVGVPSVQETHEERTETHACDLISRQAAIDALKNRWKKTRNYEGIGDDIAEECELYLKQLPSAQPEIIRCKDCKNWDTTWTNDFSPNYHYCPMVDGVRKDDWYCADAERRTDDE